MSAMAPYPAMCTSPDSRRPSPAEAEAGNIISGEKMAGKIVVGVDGSEGSRHALAWAIRQAAASGAAVQPVIVWQRSFDYGSEQYWPADEKAAGNARQQLEAAIALVAGQHPAVTIEPAVLEGAPGQVLCAQSAGADLLVVGRRGNGSGLAGLVLGSVSAQCARHAPTPVVIVPVGGEDPGPDEQEHR